MGGSVTYTYLDCVGLYYCCEKHENEYARLISQLYNLFYGNRLCLLYEKDYGQYLEKLVGKCGFSRYFLNEDCVLGPKRDCELVCVNKHESYNAICNCNKGSVLTVGLGNDCECNDFREGVRCGYAPASPCCLVIYDCVRGTCTPITQ